MSDSEVKQFSDLLYSAQTILITSHISPDPDAVTSLILAGSTFRLNFPDKKIAQILEEKPRDFEYIDGYDAIECEPLLDSIGKFSPDLLILLDGNNFERFSRKDGAQVRAAVQSKKIKVAIIDHHEPASKDQVEVYINHGYPATVHEVYDVLFSQLGLKMSTNFAKTTMIGLYADTGGFVYIKAGQEQRVFDLVKELIGQSVSVEEVKNELAQYTKADMELLSEITGNVSHQDDYSYSFISDGFIKNWLEAGKEQSDLQRGVGVFLDEFVRNIDGRKWGFIVYKNTLQGENMYSVSLRSMGNVKDVSVIAGALGGGGHKPAAGGRFEAKNLEDAIAKVKQVIKEVSS